MNDINEFLARAAERCGFVRETYSTELIPKTHDKIIVIPFFGNTRGEFIFSSLIFPRLMESSFANRYVIIATHAERAFLYNQASEVWGLQGEDMVDNIEEKSDLFTGNINFENQFIRSLNRFFPNVYNPEELNKYYKNGLTNFYFSNFGGGKIWYPAVPPIKSDMNHYILSASYPVLIVPNIHSIDVDKADRISRNIMPPEIYISLCNRLITEGFSPVVWRGPNCYDLSRELAGKAFFLVNRSLSGAIAAARGCGFVLSLFDDSYAIAYLARVPFLSVQSRNRYHSKNIFEFDELLENNISPYFSFAPPTFNVDMLGSVVNKMVDLRERGWPEKKSLGRIQEIDHTKVKKKRAKKMGFHFFKVPEIEN